MDFFFILVDIAETVKSIVKTLEKNLIVGLSVTEVDKYTTQESNLPALNWRSEFPVAIK